MANSLGHAFSRKGGGKSVNHPFSSSWRAEVTAFHGARREESGASSLGLETGEKKDKDVLDQK